MTAAEVKAALRRRHEGGGSGAWVCVEEAFSGFATWSTGGIDLLAIGVWQSAKVPGLRRIGRSGIHHPRLGMDEPDTRHATVAYEVKVSRSDFKRELYGYTPGEGARYTTRAVAPWPGKAQAALDRTNYFVFAVPKGLLHPEEVARRVPWDHPDTDPVERDQLLLALPTRSRRAALWVPEGCGLVEVDHRGHVSVRVHADPREAQPWTRHETHEVMRRIDYTAAARGERLALEAREAVAA